MLLSFRRRDKVVRVSISLSSSILEEFDKIVAREFKSRSEAIEYLIRLYIECRNNRSFIQRLIK